MNFNVTLTPKQADHLSNTTMHCFYHEQSDRFEFVDEDETTDMTVFQKNNSTMYWCDSFVEALLLKNYKTANGRKADILWDLCSNGFNSELEMVTAKRLNICLEGTKFSYVVVADEVFGH